MYIQKFNLQNFRLKNKFFFNIQFIIALFFKRLSNISHFHFFFFCFSFFEAILSSNNK
jgi:hypothetical protein